MKKIVLLLGFSFVFINIAFSQDYVTLYSDCNYRGAASKLYPGRYSLGRENVGSRNLSSIRIPPGFKVVVYDGYEPGTGSKFRYTADISCLSKDWNDRVESVVVERDNNSSSSSGPSYSSNQDGVTFYDECNYRGKNVVLRDGSYNDSQLGVGNDAISAMMIPNGWTVTVYANNNWGGASRVFSQNVSCLMNDWNNKISSVRISRSGSYSGSNSSYPGRNDGVTVYKDCNYSGQSAVLRPGYYTAGQLGVGNDAISSMRVPSGMHATVYVDNDFSGKHTDVSNDISCVSHDWNDKISSIYIYRSNDSYQGSGYSDGGYPPGGEGVTIYADSWFKGAHKSLREGTYNLSGDVMDRNISSINIQSGYRVEVYDDYRLRGNRRVITSSDYNLSSTGWNDKIKSFQVIRQN